MKKQSAYNQHPKGQTMQTTTASDLLTLPELAHKLQIHPTTARGLWRRHIIPGLKLGHRTLRFDYQTVLAALTAKGDPAAMTATK
jgi:hypothetical protein